MQIALMIPAPGVILGQQSHESHNRRVGSSTSISYFYDIWVERKCLDKWSKFHVHVSDTIDESVEKCMCIINWSSVFHPELDSGTEEADLQVMHHAANAVRNDATRMVILSGDTNVAVHGLYVRQQLQVIELQELWMRGGVGSSTMCKPLHDVAYKRGRMLC